MSTSSPHASTGTPGPRPGRSRPLAVVTLTVVLLLQSLAVLGAAMTSVLAIGAGTLGMGAQIFLAILFVLAGVWIGAAGIGLWAGKPWTRAAVVVIELFAVILSISFFTGGNVGVGLAFLLPAAVALLLMFTRQAAEHLAGIDR